MQERLIQLLESVAGSAKPVSANDLAQMTKLPRATIYRNLSSLLDCGFLDEVDDGKRYVLGIRFVKIALTGKSDSHVIKAVMAMIHRLVIDIGETAFWPVIAEAVLISFILKRRAIQQSPTSIQDLASGQPMRAPQPKPSLLSYCRSCARSC